MIPSFQGDQKGTLGRKRLNSKQVFLRDCFKTISLISLPGNQLNFFYLPVNISFKLINATWHPALYVRKVVSQPKSFKKRLQKKDTSTIMTLQLENLLIFRG